MYNVHFRQKKTRSQIHILTGCYPIRKRCRIASAVLIVLLTLLYCVPLPAFAASGEVPGHAVTVGVPTDRCPVFYRDRDSDEIVGIGVDLMRIAAGDAGLQVTFVEIREASLKEALDNEAYDVVMPFGSAVPSASGRASIVSENLFQTPFTLVTLNNQKMPSLDRLHVGMLKSLSAGAETVRQLYPGIEVTLYDTMDESVKALRKGKVDALLHNSYVWSYVLQKPSYTDLTAQPASMFSMDFRVGTLDTPEGQALIARLDSGISQLSDTQQQAVILDYTTRRLYRYDVSDYLYEQWLFLLLTVLLVICMVFIAVMKIRMMQLQQDEKMRQLIDFDPLTGALSLNGFRKRVEDLLRMYPDTDYVLTYGNIRNFKFINESLGMDAGNDLLRFWARKSMDIMSEKDALARIEADHFAALRHVEREEQFSMDNRILFDPIRHFFIHRNKEMRVQICIGVYALTPADHQKINVDQMLDFARVAEKRLRDHHKEGFAFYDSAQWKSGKLMVNVVSRLSVAIQTREIQVWYQPQVNYETGQIVGAEALCRWNHAQQGWISPAEFVPALEEAGLIYDLDCYVWESVCQDLHRWNEKGNRFSVSVNLSRADFVKNPELPEHFRQLIETYALTPDQLHLEITETAYVENPELLIVTTQKFREYGFRVEMDDFGSGYSSLNMLKEVQVDRIKLDLHFLTETGDPEKGRIIIEHMIRMSHSLGMGLIAEGVEREEQAQFLHSLGCQEMQGFYYYRPMPSEQYELTMLQDPSCTQDQPGGGVHA